MMNIPESNEYGRQKTFYSGLFTLQFQHAVTQSKNEPELVLNVTIGKKVDGRYFGEKLTTQLAVDEMAQLACTLLRWQGFERFEAGYHGSTNNKVLYANINSNNNQAAVGGSWFYNFIIKEGDRQLSVNVPAKHQYSLSQFVLNRLAEAGSARQTVTDTLNLLSQVAKLKFPR